ncbi:MAG: tetraacyldisaccharide 4'-kinase [Rikenellaceae bacterium]|jgi:tetraacyldisaccharide 4'-kinase|nr:tetraacyldisaccharide 4'-kinase [Rikenellaceae bacterium]
MRKLFLAPLAWIYGVVLSIRNRLYDAGTKKSISYDIPIVCVGNITTGGTGKTPMCELLIDHFSKIYTVALLSRGYGRKTKGYVEVEAKSSYRKVGDEPKQIKLKYPEAVVVVCEDREKGIDRILAEHPEVGLIIMDDGFQHRRIEPKINIVMVDYTRPMDKDHLLPLGTLRDSPRQLHRAHYVVVTKCPPDMTPLSRRITLKRLELLPYQRLFFTQTITGNLYPAFAGSEREAVRAGSPVVGMAAIGNPAPFVDNLRRKYNLVESLLFGDHHPYRVSDLRAMEHTLERAPEGTVIVTTEKDAVKLGTGSKMPPSLRSKIWVQPMAMRFVVESKEDFLKKLEYDVRTNQTDRFFYRK